MSQNNTTDIVKKSTLLQVTKDEIIQSRKLILQLKAPLWRKKKNGQYSIVPADKLDHFLGNRLSSEIQFYMEKDWVNRIREKIKIKKSGSEIQSESQEKLKKQNKASIKPDSEQTFKKHLEIFQKMSLDERENYLNKDIETIDDMIKMNKSLDLDNVKDIVKITTKAFYISKTTLTDNLNDNIQIPKQKINSIIAKTTILIDSMANLIQQEKVSYKDLNYIEDISTGSSTVDHMNKVLLRAIPFGIFYNEYFDKGLIAKIRAEFKNKFYNYYHQLMPYEKNISLQTVFKNGIRRMNALEFRDYALGTLLHDIGKLPDINYHDGSEGYNPRKVISHAPVSYNMIIKSGGFPWGVAVMAALHHEYYGHESGYKVEKVLFRHFKKYSQHQDYKRYFITYAEADIKNGEAFAYFPCKMLEIIDVFDALTDQNRRYRGKDYSIENALELMRKEFIETNLKIDPILFNIFVEFVKEYTVLNDPGKLDTIMI